MSVRPLAGKCVLWECSGTSGTVVFQLLEDSGSSTEMTEYPSRPKFVLIPAPLAKAYESPISIDYALEDMLSATLQEECGQLWTTMSDGIIDAFARMSIYT